MGIFDNAVSVIIGNKIVDSITTSDNGVIYQRSEHTRLSIDVPLNLTYSDAFNITGHLTTANGTGISGEQVLLKVGNTVMDSTTTGNNGAYSFTQTPVYAGTHTFQVVYAGSNTYGDSESSTVTRDVNKETTVLTAILDKQKYDIGDDVTITVGFSDDEGNNLISPDNTINLKINYDGTWRNVPSIIQFLAKGTIKIQYQESYNSTWELRHDESRNYAYSHINIPLNIVTPTLITSSATNQVITSGDSTTVTATLLDQDGDAIPNRTLSYNVKHGSTTLDTGSATTDSNGQISVSYTGTAVGQVDFEFSYGNFLQETYEVLDCLFVDDGITDPKPSGTWVRSGTGNQLTIDDNGTTLYATSEGIYRNTTLINGDFEAVWEAKSTGGAVRYSVRNESSPFQYTQFLHSTDDFLYYKLKRVGSTFTAQYSNDGVNWTNRSFELSNVTDNDCYFMFRITGASSDAPRTVTYKNLRIYSA